jgi:hypothetical protein
LQVLRKLLLNKNGFFTFIGVNEFGRSVVFFITLGVEDEKVDCLFVGSDLMRLNPSNAFGGVPCVCRVLVAQR